jgi:hypothetical protein
MRAKSLLITAITCAALVGGTGTAGAKGTGSIPVPGGIALPGSPFRYQAFSPGYPGKVTVITRANRAGGKVSKWWTLRGGWFVAGSTPTVATGLSADGSRLVLVKQQIWDHTGQPPDTRLAIMRPQVSLRRAPGTGRPHWVDFARLPGEWAIVAISPDGAALFVRRGETVRALDTASGRLRPGAVRDREGERVRVDGFPFSQAGTADGRWTYTLYADNRGRPFVYALDGENGRGTRIDLPRLRGLREPYSVHLELENGGRSLDLIRTWFPRSHERQRTLAVIDTATLAVRGPQPQAFASFQLGW